MFNLPEFHAVSKQRCKDMLDEAERERLALEVTAHKSGGKISSVTHSLLSKLRGSLESSD